MKKYLIILAVAIIAGIFVSSCKSSEHCPAYGQADQDSTIQDA